MSAPEDIQPHDRSPSDWFANAMLELEARDWPPAAPTDAPKPLAAAPAADAPDACERSLDELLYHWRAVIGAAPKGFPRDFALSIQKHRKRPGWQPTARQLVVMRQMVAELFTHGRAGDAPDLVEVD